MDSAITRFKNNITIMEVESSSFCNRKCTYCINYKIDRRTKKEFMDESLFKKIIDELAEVDYDRILTFHRFNEPFEEKNEMILKRIAYARKRLKHARLITSSNGDYLDQEYLIKIQESGLDELYVQCHYDYAINKNEEDIRKDIRDVNLRLGNYMGKFVHKNNAIIYCTVNSPLKVLTIEAKNFMLDGFDRGGMVSLEKSRIVEGPCYAPYTTMAIDFNGKVNMCCNLVSYIKDHEKYCLGDASNNTLFEIYNSDKARIIQERLYQGIRPDVCSRCECNYKNFLNKFELDPTHLL